MNQSDLVIIGSGPAGLTAAIYAARANLKPVVLAGLVPGGQLMTTSEVENYPGFPEGIMGPELMDKMTKQAERFGATMVYENVVSADFQSKPFKLITQSNAEFTAKAVIISTGAEAKWLGLESEQRLRGKGVSACATCDGFFFKGKDVVVVGGGDSAMEETLFLTKFATKVYLVHRREEFRASKIMVERVKNHPQVELVLNSETVEVLGDQNVTGVKVKNVNTNEERTIAAQGFFAAIGHTPATKVFVDAGIEVDSKGYIVVKDHTHTNIEGVFVAGDVHDPRYRQAVTAAGFGCMASLDAEKYLAH